MPTSISLKSKPAAYRIFSGFVAFTFAFNLILPPSYAQLIPQTLLDLPAPGAMVPASAAFMPTLIKGLTIHPENPLEFDFIVQKGDKALEGAELQKESMRLVKYFLASLTVPEEQMWVNLSPYEAKRIIGQDFGATEMGRDMLAQDYILKQLTASLMYPENELGKKFWDRVYKKAYEKYGTTEIPMNTFNKVWIVPAQATVYEHEGSVFVVESRLKVMLEEDYVALESHRIDDLNGADPKAISGISSEIVREVLIPEIEKEVNEGENFANLRQIYNSMILATWYKKNLRQSLLGQVYVDKAKTKGVDLKDPQVNQKIYEQYIAAFKKGVYNYIREDYDETTKEVVPRKYFSGGAVGLKESNLTTLYSLPPAQQKEIVAAFQDIGNTEGARFKNLKVKLFEIAKDSGISEEMIEQIAKDIENMSADEARDLFVDASSPLADLAAHLREEAVKSVLKGLENPSLERFMSYSWDNQTKRFTSQETYNVQTVYVLPQPIQLNGAIGQGTPEMTEIINLLHELEKDFPGRPAVFYNQTLSADNKTVLIKSVGVQILDEETKRSVLTRLKEHLQEAQSVSSPLEKIKEFKIEKLPVISEAILGPAAQLEQKASLNVDRISGALSQEFTALYRDIQQALDEIKPLQERITRASPAAARQLEAEIQSIRVRLTQKSQAFQERIPLTLRQQIQVLERNLPLLRESQTLQTKIKAGLEDAILGKPVVAVELENDIVAFQGKIKTELESQMKSLPGDIQKELENLEEIIIQKASEQASEKELEVGGIFVKAISKREGKADALWVPFKSIGNDYRIETENPAFGVDFSVGDIKIFAQLKVTSEGISVEILADTSKRDREELITEAKVIEEVLKVFSLDKKANGEIVVASSSLSVPERLRKLFAQRSGGRESTISLDQPFDQYFKNGYEKNVYEPFANAIKKAFGITITPQDYRGLEGKSGQEVAIYIESRLPDKEMRNWGLVSSPIVDSKGLIFRQADELFSAVQNGLATSVASPVESAQGPKRILLAEDNKDVRSNYQKRLEKAGHIVTAVEDGAKAWEVYQQDPGSYDLVLTDYEMPNMIGPELVKNIQEYIKRSNGKSMPFIILSGDLTEVKENNAKSLNVPLYSKVEGKGKLHNIQETVAEALEISSSPLTIEQEKIEAKIVGNALHTVLEKNSKSAGSFLSGGYQQPGYGVAAGAVNDGSHAIDGEGNQGYYVGTTNIPDGRGGFKSGKQVFVDTTNGMKSFFAGRAKRNNKPIKVVIKTGIGGQHTPFQGIASVFEKLDSGRNRIIGEYELGKDYQAYLEELVREMGIGWDQIAVIPSSKSGSTDETMMVFVDIMKVLLQKTAATYTAQGAAINGEKFAEAFLDYLHTINFKDGKELPGGDLFKGFNLDDLARRINQDAENRGVTSENVREILGKVLGNMFFETTDRPQDSRLSAFIRNSGLDRLLGEDAPGFGAMFDNVGGRWTGDLHMMTFLAFYGLNAEDYWQARYNGIKDVREGTHVANELGNAILDQKIQKIALLVPDELYWFGQGIEQNFNESIWQKGYANLRTVTISEWEHQRKLYTGKDALVINMSDLNVQRLPNVFKIEPVKMNNRQTLAKDLARAFTIFYGMTYTVGTRLIGRALEAGGHTAADVDVNDLTNPATKIVQENLFLRQPYVELGKGLLSDFLQKLQQKQLAWEQAERLGVSPIDQWGKEVAALAKNRDTQYQAREVFPSDKTEDLAGIIRSAAQYAQGYGKTFVPFIYLEGNKYEELRQHLRQLGYEWVLQGTGSQHISWQQVLANPNDFFPLVISMIPEESDMLAGHPAIGFAKGYLHHVNPNVVRDLFAMFSYQAFKNRGGEGFFMRMVDTDVARSQLNEAFTQAASSPVTLEQAGKNLQDLAGKENIKGEAAVAFEQLTAALNKAAVRGQGIHFQELKDYLILLNKADQSLESKVYEVIANLGVSNPEEQGVKAVQELVQNSKWTKSTGGVPNDSKTIFANGEAKIKELFNMHRPPTFQMLDDTLKNMKEIAGRIKQSYIQEQPESARYEKLEQAIGKISFGRAASSPLTLFEVDYGDDLTFERVLKGVPGIMKTMSKRQKTTFTSDYSVPDIFSRPTELPIPKKGILMWEGSSLISEASAASMILREIADTFKTDLAFVANYNLRKNTVQMGFSYRGDRSPQKDQNTAFFENALNDLIEWIPQQQMLLEQKYPWVAFKENGSKDIWTRKKTIDTSVGIKARYSPQSPEYIKAQKDLESVLDQIKEEILIIEQQLRSEDKDFESILKEISFMDLKQKAVYLQAGISQQRLIEIDEVINSVRKGNLKFIGRYVDIIRKPLVLEPPLDSEIARALGYSTYPASSPVQLVKDAQMVNITSPSIKPLNWGTAGARDNTSDFTQNILRQAAGFAEEVQERIAQKKYRPLNGNKIRVVVGYDARESAQEDAAAMASVIAAYTGFEVMLTDEILPTPIIGRLTQSDQQGAFDFGFHLTASHNQSEWKGLKFLTMGTVNEDSWTDPFSKRANLKTEYPVNPNAQIKGIKVADKLIEEYLTEVFPGIIEAFNRFKENNPNATFTIDFMHGSVIAFAPLFARLDIKMVRTTPMKAENFSNRKYVLKGKTVGYAPDPTQEAFYGDQPEYQNFIKNAPDGSMYFLTDGDGDRLVVIVKKNGKPVVLSPNKSGVLFMDYILTNRLMPNITRVARTYVTTAGVDAVAQYHGMGEPIILAVGSKYFNPYFPNVLALEESGHFVAGKYFDDTVYQFGLILTMITKTNKDLLALIADTQEKIKYKGIDGRDDYENLSPELKEKFRGPLFGTPQEVKAKTQRIVDQVVQGSGGKKLKEALVVVERTDGPGGDVISLPKYVESLFTDNPLRIEPNNVGIIVRFDDLSWGGARLSGTGNTARLYAEGRESKEERERIVQSFVNAFGLASSPIAEEVFQDDENEPFSQPVSSPVTSVHQVVKVANVMFESGQVLKAQELLRELVGDLKTAKENKDIGFLLRKWNVRIKGWQESKLTDSEFQKVWVEANALLRSVEASIVLQEARTERIMRKEIKAADLVDNIDDKELWLKYLIGNVGMRREEAEPLYENLREGLEQGVSTAEELKNILAEMVVPSSEEVIQEYSENVSNRLLVGLIKKGVPKGKAEIMLELWTAKYHGQLFAAGNLIPIVREQLHRALAFSNDEYNRDFIKEIEDGGKDRINAFFSDVWKLVKLHKEIRAYVISKVKHKGFDPESVAQTIKESELPADIVNQIAELAIIWESQSLPQMAGQARALLQAASSPVTQGEIDALLKLKNDNMGQPLSKEYKDAVAGLQKIAATLRSDIFSIDSKVGILKSSDRQKQVDDAVNEIISGGRKLEGEEVNILSWDNKAVAHIDGVLGRQLYHRYEDINDRLLYYGEMPSEQESTSVSSPAAEFIKGGIDLNPALLDLQIKRDGNGVPLPLPQQPIGEMRIDGFIPVIINITPVANLPLLLGFADTQDDTDEASPAFKAREPEEISALN